MGVRRRSHAAAGVGPDRQPAATTALLCLLGSVSLFFIAAPARAATAVVQMINYTFDPPQTSVNTGDTIIWTNVDLDVHTTTSGSNAVPNGLWDTSLLVPGDSFSFTFNVAPGSYPYFCRVHFNIGMLGGVTVVTANNPPSVSFVTPTNGAVFIAGAPVSLQASALDSDGSISRVDFSANGALIGSATSSPYTITFTNAIPGSYALRAVAVDNQGAASAPATVSILLLNPGNGPSVLITNPAEGASFFVGTNILVQTLTSDSNAAITQVQFNLDTNNLGTVAGPPFQFALTNLAVGNYALTAVALDSLGFQATSPPVRISVVLPPAPVPPLVTLLAPVDGARFPLGSTVTLLASASVSNAILTNLQFFADSNLVGEAIAPPFTLNWTPAQPGLITLTAVAFSSQGLAATSSPVQVRVFTPENVRPGITITRAPRNFASLNSSDILLSGAAQDNQGVDRVEFHINGGAFQTAAGTATWSAAVTLAPGHNAVGVRSVDFAGNTSLEAVRFYTYTVRAPLAAQTAGDGTIVPNLDGHMLELGKIYRMTARPGSGQIFNGWSGVPNGSNPRLNFQMQSNLLLIANFIPNPFSATANYSGLILDTNGALPANTASLHLHVGATGFFSGRLGMNGAVYPFLGRFNMTGTAVAPVLRRNLAPIALNLQLDWTAASNPITGSATDGTWTAPITAKRDAFSYPDPAPQAGKIPFVLQSASGDPGAIAGSAQVLRTGGVVLSGRLPDGRRFTGISELDRNGDAAIYVGLGDHNEIIAGWLNFGSQAGGTASGHVFWSKPAGDGFSVSLLTAH